ncbi:Uncharacterized protein Adt_19502 [Abeliophyllum distichum]|uniref:Uncharacterized protein n=1 Tax=Abeliophyllum distichum TaxID=126358 RepID=A0ABD1STP0_9LAMI
MHDNMVMIRNTSRSDASTEESSRWIQDDIKLYLFGKEEVYNVDSQSFGVHVLDTIVGNLGYSLPITYMYKESGKGVADGLRKLITEADVEDMIQELGVDKTVEIYFVPPGSENVDD